MLFRPRVPLQGETERTDQDKERDVLSDQDMDWLKIKIGPDWDSMSHQEFVSKIRALNDPGKEACKAQEGMNRQYALCCLGPEQEIIVPTLGYRLVRKQQAIIINVFSCELYIEGRPYCEPMTKYAYCCKDRDTKIITDWGYKGLDCVHLERAPEPWLWEVRELKAEPKFEVLLKNSAELLIFCSASNSW